MTVDSAAEPCLGPGRTVHPVDRPSATLAAAYLVALNTLVGNIQPLILGALARGYGFTDRQLGHVSSVYIGAITLCSLSAPLWIRRVNWRILALASVAACAAVFAGGATLRTSGMFLLLFAGLGVLKGGFGSPAYASLGDSSNPDRAYGISTVLQGLTAAAIAAPVESVITPRYGVSGVLLFLALIYATGLIAAFWMPPFGRSQASLTRTMSAPPSLFSRVSIPPIIGVAATGLFAGGVLAFWYFVERIGAAQGVPSTVIGLTLSLTALASIGTAGVMAWLGGRLPTIGFVAAGTAMIVTSYFVLEMAGNVPFIVCNLLFALGWGFATPGYATIVRKVDATGRLFVAAPAAGGAAGVVIGILAGPLIERGGFRGLLIFSGAMILAAMFLGMWALAFSGSIRPGQLR